MKICKAFKIFLYLLHSDQWYIVAEDKYKRNHTVECSINIGSLAKFVNDSIDDAIGQDEILQEVKDLLNL